jgi:hypothetical protein
MLGEEVMHKVCSYMLVKLRWVRDKSSTQQTLKTQVLLENEFASEQIDIWDRDVMVL